MPNPETGFRKRLGRGEGLDVLNPIDLNKTTTISELVQAMSLTAFGGRRLGEAVNVLEEMVRDKDCFRVLTLSGAMTVAKQTLIICEMIERGWIQAIVSTGALICHGVVEGAGMKHFKCPADFSDIELEKEGYNRIYDTIEPEYNLVQVENLIKEFVSELLEQKGVPLVISSYEFCSLLGEYLLTSGTAGRGILKSARRHHVPVYIPALTDSELGLDILLENLAIYMQKNSKIDNLITDLDFALFINPFQDLWDYFRRVLDAKRLGILTIGGGVPRNWAQQVGPMTEIFAKRIHWKYERKRFAYGVRICPEPEHWGGLSGCSYSEGKSWGKLEPEAKTAEVLTDATIALPIIVRAVIERME